MSTTWYECKVKYRKINESGVQKVTTEPYLVDALSYTEAETRINEEMSAYISEEFKITNIKIANFAEIHPFDNSDRWFKSKVALVSYDEESGKERKSSMYLLVQANDVKEAYDNTISMMKDSVSDYTVPAISESPIMDVFPYFSGEEEQFEKAQPVTVAGSSQEEVPEEVNAVEEELLEEVNPSQEEISEEINSNQEEVDSSQEEISEEVEDI
ncbi:DUF4494 domain-containing protein [Aquimarina megaterium]|uniref:DUF4494 domain-containing protein n=1 Tax=Aquimarina megaterium TaxID=1443666 RepID=UPI000943CAB9|nr:DUF4494 domain-containing protein [Aquimarina megaterium]